MGSATSSEKKGQKLKSALRDNLKKRKAQARRLKGEGENFSMKLRDKTLSKDDC